MNPKDMNTPADVAHWLKNHVEWNDVASQDMMLRAVEILTPKMNACLHGHPACDECVAHDTMLHMST